jgi:hypothetical protein
MTDAGNTTLVPANRHKICSHHHNESDIISKTPLKA